MPKNKKFGSPARKGLNLGGMQGLITSGRVKFVLLNNKQNEDVFKTNGEWSGLGGILYEDIGQPTPEGGLPSNFAKPLFPNIKIPPVLNEFVYIIDLPTPGVQEDINAVTHYYFQPINMWNSVHHNAVPDTVISEDDPTDDYDKTESGFVRKVTDGATDIDLGKTFNEKIDTRNLQLYEGDIVLQGRWGQSLRFGSTVANGTPTNLWSSTGENGEPITIIRNQQYKDSSIPTWETQLEDINKDKSSVYLTSTQRIPLRARSNYESYTAGFGETPSSPSSYRGSQIILNSGRLMFNAKSDHILLATGRTISFNAGKGFNFDTTANFVVKVGTQINLGDRADNGADEPIILGNKFLKQFKTLLTKLNSLCTALPSVGTPAPGVPNVAVAAQATFLSVHIQQMMIEIENYKSKTTFTK